METLGSLFQSADDGACGIDEQQRIVLWNRAAEGMLGFKASEVLGRHCFDVFRGVGEDGCQVCGPGCRTFARVCRAKSVATNNLQVRAKQGATLWLSVSTLALPPGMRPRAVLVHLFRDISLYKACQEAVDHVVDRIGRPPGALRAGRPAGNDCPDQARCLTAREHEVLRLLASGMPTRALAETLSISVSTVRNHIHNILRKLKVHSRMEAVMIAMRNGLL